MSFKYKLNFQLQKLQILSQPSSKLSLIVNVENAIHDSKKESCSEDKKEVIKPDKLPLHFNL